MKFKLILSLLLMFLFSTVHAQTDAILDGRWVSDAELKAERTRLSNTSQQVEGYIVSAKDTLCLCVDFYTYLPLQGLTPYRDCGDITEITYGSNHFLKVTRMDMSVDYHAIYDRDGRLQLKVTPQNIRAFSLPCELWWQPPMWDGIAQ